MTALADLAQELGITGDELRARLSGDSGEAEVLQPTYLTVDSAGKVSADFSGHVHAGGLDLDESTVATPPRQNRVNWIRTSDGALIAGVESTIIGTTGITRVKPETQPFPASVTRQQTEIGSNATVLFTDEISGGTTEAGVTVGVLTKIILDSVGGGRSDWLQLDPNTFQRAVLQFGIGTVTFPGGSNDSNTNVINLSGGAGTFTQAYFLAIAIEAAGNARFAYIVGPSVGSFGVRLNSVVGAPPAGTNENYYWFAIQTQ